MLRCPPILRRSYTSPRSHDSEVVSTKPWTAYILPVFAVVLILVPQPSWLILVTTQYSGAIIMTHLVVTTLLTLGAINSLAICVFADPGRPTVQDLDAGDEEHANRKNKNTRHSRDGQNSEEVEALMDEDEEDDDPNSFNSSLKWCRTCWAPKPDRTHHCSTCNRCVLKMDHHCPWVSQCVGHRTYPSFLHLLACVTLLASYIATTSSFILYSFLFTPIAQPIDDTTPLHCLLLVAMGFIFSLVIGSFFAYHIYLCFTNQTTIEQLSPFLLLKYLPKPRIARHAPGTSITRHVGPSATASSDSPYHFPPLSSLTEAGLDTPITPSRVFSSSPVATTTGEAYLKTPGSRDYRDWGEHSLSSPQRRLVRRTASRLRLWDIGWRANITSSLGAGNIYHSGGRKRDGGGPGPYSLRWWLAVLLYGGPPRGDGKTFPKNKRSKVTLRELRTRLEQLEVNEGTQHDSVDGRYAVADEEEHEMDDV
jgi:palmitoyltransferase ZDHHC2/15/20